MPLEAPPISGMPGTIICSPSGGAALGKVKVGDVATAKFVLSNIGTDDATLTSIALSVGGEWVVTPTAMPDGIAPGQSRTYTVTFTPLVAGVKVSNLTFHWTNFYGDHIISLPLTATVNLVGATIWDPATLSYPTLQVRTTDDLVVNLKNTDLVDVNITALAFTDGLQYSMVAPPVLPFLLAAGLSQPITVRFNPLNVGTLTDTLTATDDNGNTPGLGLSGLCLALFPIAICLNNELRLVVGGYDALGVASKPAPIVSSPDDYNANQAGTLIFNGSIWSGLGVEKTLVRLGFYYENLGEVTLTGTVSCYRPQIGANSIDAKAFSITFGTAAADGSERYAEVDVVATGELLQLSLARAISAGALSLMAIVPYFVARGEKVKDV